MMPERWREGEAAVVGLGRSGVGAALLLAREGVRVYASDGASEGGAAAGAARLAAAGIEAIAGAHDLDRIARATVVGASPGVPPPATPGAASGSCGRRTIRSAAGST